MTQSVKLVSVATAVPSYILEQRDVAAAAHRAFALRYTDFERLARVFKTSGIRRRYAICPMEWYFEPLGWPERSRAYRDGACQLFVDAANKALESARPFIVLPAPKNCAGTRVPARFVLVAAEPMKF